jgi:hypothetical protein
VFSEAAEAGLAVAQGLLGALAGDVAEHEQA